MTTIPRDRPHALPPYQLIAPLTALTHPLEAMVEKCYPPVPLSPERAEKAQATTAEVTAYCRAYRELRLARWTARSKRIDARENPVTLSCLRDLGVDHPLLMRLLYHVQVEHFRPPLGAAGHDSKQLLTQTLQLGAGSLFYLTDMGEAFAALFLGDGPVTGTETHPAAAWDRFLHGELVPRYDKDNRNFGWGARRLKSFRQPSCNQELLLLTAEELNWPAWFDDPLPKQAGKNAKERLHDAIKDLNRRQTPHLIQFKGDGTGTRVGWEYR
jgi:hypothetical protein